MKYPLIILFSLTMFSGIGQIDFKKLVPPNPDVAAIMKPVLTPVTEYAGLPNINIPLYTIQEDGMAIPISLAYHPGGIQVSEESGHVGLGWALNAGGAISRTINGMGDFGEGPLNPAWNKYLQTDQPLPDYEVTTENGESYFSPTYNSLLRSDSSCQLPVDGNPTYFPPFYDVKYSQDYLPDTFHFSFNGYSGSFVLKPNGDVFQLEKSGLKITYEQTSGAVGFNYKFTMTTEDGTRYDFDSWQKTSTNLFDSPTIFTSTWFLTKITTINGREINFNYDNVGTVNGNIATGGLNLVYPLKTFVQNLFVPGQNYETTVGPQTAVEDLYLTNITFTDGQIDFIYSAEGDRQDIPTAHYLEKIEVKNSQKTIKTYDFGYSYFGDANAASGSLNTGDYSNEINFSSGNPSLNLRLRLDTLVESNVKVHSFDYFDANIVPNKTSMSQDYWGFYNGILNTNSFVPQTSLGNTYNISSWAKRYPVQAKAKLFSLKRIKYPTGGYTEFDYESNTYDPTAIDYNFWESDYIPTNNGSEPLNTVQKSQSAVSFGGTNWVTKSISPASSNDVTIRFDLAIYDSSIEPNGSGLYLGGPFNFQTDMSLILRRNHDNVIIWEQGYFSAQAALDFEQTGMAFNSVTIARPLNHPDGYTLEAYFDNHNTTYFGQAKITATWEEIGVTGDGSGTDPQDYSVGGGLRVKSITDFDNNERQAQKRVFDYHYTQNINGVQVEKSYGKLKTLPDYALNQPYYTRIGGSIEQLISSSSSTNPLAKDQGSYVGYSQVEMRYEDFARNDNGKTVTKFYNFVDYAGKGNNLDLEYIEDFYNFSPIRIPHSGRAYEIDQFKQVSQGSYSLVSKTINDYQVNGISATTFNFKDFLRTSDYVMSGRREWVPLWDSQHNETLCLNSLFHFRPVYATRVNMVKTQQVQYDEDGQNPLVSTQDIFYDNPSHYMPTRTQLVDSKGNTRTTQTWYPDDIVQSATIEGGDFQEYLTIVSMLHDGPNARIGQPIQILSVNNGKKTLARTNFSDWGNGIVQPSSQQSLKGELSTSNGFQDNILAYDYDAYGNPLEFSQDGGPLTSYIWGHNKKYLIAKIENASYQDIADALGIGVNDVKALTENQLATIDGLRTSLAKAMVTTYTYDPLVGITTMTDPRGYTMKYYYDDLNRLIEVKDAQDHIISDYKYKYKNQAN